MMPKLLRGLFFGFVILSASLLFKNPEVLATEAINSFYSLIEVNQDTSLTITEQIHYTTTVSKHGIYRYIPISYNKDGQREALPVTTVSVTDELGAQIPFTKSSDGAFLTLKIGDPNTTFLGEKSYVITYTVERGINQFDTHAELYWDITGEGWQVPIQQSSATVISKFAPIEQVECLSGAVGSDDGLCNFEAGQNQAVFTYLEPITYGENMTIVVGFPKESQLVFPTQTDLFLFWIKNNWPILFLPVPTVVMFLWWLKKGRDIEFISQNVFDLDQDRPTRLRPVQLSARQPLVYEPLKDLTPGEAGALLDEKADIQDVVAEILELARKKYIKITVSEKKVLFTTTREYQFEKLALTAEGLNEVQAYLFSELFKTGEVVTLSKLKGTFHTVVTQARAKLESALVEKNLYTVSPTKARGTGVALFLILIGTGFGLFKLTLVPLGITWPLFLLFFQIPLGLLLASNLPQKTAVGTNLWLQSRGLRATIQRGAWREKIKEKNLFIEEILPFAVSLGVVKQLAKDMEELQIKPPEYISGAGVASWGMSGFVAGFSQEVGSSLSYNPASSSSSGGSGFSGGSSGGGGGGGGGGSW